MTERLEDRKRLDFEELEDLEKIIERGLGTKSARLTPGARDFLADVGDRLNKWGEKLRVSKKQWDWLVSIGTKVGVELE